MVWVSVDSLINTAFRRVCPLYSFDARDRVHLVASAVPFAAGDLRFLITAAHACFNGSVPTPLFVQGMEGVHPLVGRRGAWEYQPGHDADLDVAVIELTAECAADLEAFHWFNSLAQVADTMPPNPSTHYLIAGYPASRNRKRPPRYGLPSRATALLLGDIRPAASVPGADKSDEHHFALALPDDSVPKAGGGSFRVPKPRGMSGGGVWRVEVDAIRRFVSTPLLVGIGVEFHASQKMFLATRVHRAAQLARNLTSPPESSADPTLDSDG